MLVKRLAILLPLIAAVSARRHQKQFVTPKENADGCPEGSYMIGVRGTLEEPGLGALGDVADAVMKKLPDSEVKAIEYPANGIIVRPGETPIYNFIQYRSSVAMGVQALTNELEEFNYYCPNTKVVLMGYSQGAQVIGDTLCGVHGPIFVASQPLQPEYSRNIKAIVQLGDPRNVANIPWHAGNSTHGGIFPRQNFEACESLGHVWKSYCDDNDLFCDKGESVPVHMGYVEKYQDDIVEHIVGKVKNADKEFHYCAESPEL